MGRFDHHYGRDRQRQRRRGRARWLIISLAAHLALALLLLLATLRPYAVPTTEVTEVELVTQESKGQRPSDADGQRVEQQQATREHDEALRQRLATTTARPELPRPKRRATPKTTQPRRVRRSARRARVAQTRPRKRPPVEPPKQVSKSTDTGKKGVPPLPQAQRGDAKPSCLLSMRGCSKAASPSRSTEPKKADRFASFRPRRPSMSKPRKALARPSVRARIEHDGLAMSRYADGGRLIQARGKRTKAPGYGEVGLMTLASSKLGSSTGHLACDPYRRASRSGRRTLVLLVDTSGSITENGKAPAAIVCAAGAALAALRQGHDVTVANFSSSVWYLRKTRDTNAIYSVLSRLQRAKTKLPPATLFADAGPRPRDFVLVTDTGIDNLKAVAPGYRRLLASRADNRALLYVLGDGSDAHIAALKLAGFAPNFVERRMDKSFASFALSKLEAPLRRALQKNQERERERERSGGAPPRSKTPKAGEQRR